MPNKSRSRAYCCVVGCHNYRSCSTDVKFYSFPLRDYKREQREKWIKAVKKENSDGSPWLPNKNSLICSKHFIGNAKSDHPLSPSFVPTIFPSQYHTKQQTERQQLNALSSSDGSPWLPNKNSLICSKHFIGNAKSDHPLSPSFVPTIFPSQYHTKQQTERQQLNALSRFQRRMQRNSTKTRIQNETKETKVGKPPIFTESLAHEINPPIQQVFVKSEPESTFLENFNDFDTDIKPDSLQGLHSEHESTFPEVFDDSKLDIKPNIMQITQSEYESTFDSEIDIKPTIVDIPKSEYESIFPVGFDDFKTDIKPNIAHIKKIDNSTQVNFLPNDSNFDIFFCNLNQNGNKCVAETQASFRDYEQINGRKVIVRKVYDWHGKDVRICIE